MKPKKLGRTGLDVSPLCLGCMTYGHPNAGKHAWTLDAANTSSAGTSEEMIGAMPHEFTRRDEIIVATTVFYPVHEDGPHQGGLSPKAIDVNLARLGVGKYTAVNDMMDIKTEWNRRKDASSGDHPGGSIPIRRARFRCYQDGRCCAKIY